MASEIVIASDHAAFEQKEFLKKTLETKGFRVKDLGCYSSESVNYPDYAHQLAKYVLENKCRGVLICGSGIGMSIAANRHKGIRAALCHSVEYAKLSREHNDANVLVLGARFATNDLIQEITDAWLKTEFAGGRHQTRVDLIENC